MTVVDSAPDDEQKPDFRLYGAGIGKANRRIHKLDLGDGQTFDFCIKEIDALQAFMTALMNENRSVHLQNEKLANAIAALDARLRNITGEPVKRGRGRPRKNPVNQNIEIKPRIRVQAGSQRIAA